MEKTTKNVNQKLHFSEYSSEENFDYLLILDFEANCYNKDEEVSKTNPVVENEIIEFPCLALNTKTKEVEFKFHLYVKPLQKLTPFCTNLTGIEQSTVDVGEKLEDVLVYFDSWLKESGILETNFIFCTCGDWDLKTCLKNDCFNKKIEYNQYFKRWINIKNAFSEVSGTKKVGMPQMLDYFKLKLDGKHHSGIDDCYNISKIAIELLKKNVKWGNTISQYTTKKITNK